MPTMAARKKSVDEAKAAAKGEPFEVTFKKVRLGMKIDRFQRRLTVIEFEDGPGKKDFSEARLSGLVQIGDEILKINGKDVQGGFISDVVRRLASEPRPLTLTFLRNSILGGGKTGMEKPVEKENPKKAIERERERLAAAAKAKAVREKAKAQRDEKRALARQSSSASSTSSTKKSKTKVCASCGKTNVAHAKFCAGCGLKFGSEPPAATASNASEAGGNGFAAPEEDLLFGTANDVPTNAAPNQGQSSGADLLLALGSDSSAMTQQPAQQSAQPPQNPPQQNPFTAGGLASLYQPQQPMGMQQQMMGGVQPGYQLPYQSQPQLGLQQPMMGGMQPQMGGMQQQQQPTMAFPPQQMGMPQAVNGQGFGGSPGMGWQQQQQQQGGMQTLTQGVGSMGMGQQQKQQSNPFG